jgi:HK97 family phage major capsid protein
MGTEEKVMTQEDLVALIGKTIKESGPAVAQQVFAEMKSEANKGEMKKIFPHFGEEGDFSGGDLKSKSGSVLDFSCFRKAGSHSQTDKEYAESLVRIGGPFKKLSPAMEAWGRLLKCTGNRNALMRFPYAELEETIKSEAKAYGIKLDAMAETDLTNGSYLVPVEYPSMIIEAAVKPSPVLDKVWRFPMNASIVSLPKLTQSDGSYFGGVKFQEAGGISDAGGVITNSGEGVKIKPKKAGIERIKLEAQKVVAGIILTDELIQDSVINIVNYMTGLLVRAWKYRLEFYVIQGLGNAYGQPVGIVNDPGVIATAIPRIKAGELNYKDLVKLDGDLDEIFSEDAFWLMRKKTIADLRLKTDLLGQPIVKETWGERNGTPLLTPSILASPYHVTKNCRPLGDEGDVIIGNMGMYILGIRSDMRIDISDAPRFEYDETNVRFVARLDGKPAADFAFKMLAGKQS